MPDEIRGFNGEWAFLSNFAVSRIIVSGKAYATVEHAYQAHKAVRPADHERIRQADTAGQAKRLGRQVPIRDDWEQVKVALMELFVGRKFQDPWMAEHLLATDNRLLVETNTWHDDYWGDCVCAGHIHRPGRNELGKVLMAIRERMVADA
jgi:ribA/ribD-fused uncharacterized protein